MSGSHQHTPSTHGRAFALGIGLNLAFVAVEATFGFISGSLALLADAGHNLSDVLGLVLAWGASVLARRKPTERYTYGLRGASILAALLNALLLLVAVGAIGWEAVQRLGQPAPVATGTVMLVAGVGTLINTATALLFWKGRQSDLNIRGAFLHMAADAGVSLGVVLAGALISFTGWMWLDSGVTLGIALLILVGTWGLLRDSVNLALHAVPANIDMPSVRLQLTQSPGVAEVHDLHVWAMSTTEAALTAHLVVSEQPLDDSRLSHLKRLLHDRFGIEHVTLQLESDTARNCRPLASNDAVSPCL
ncbi:MULTISPECIES: cation diffusion facilitator family transporter [Myxococcus]|uniref:Cation transporter n=1 Tax=Myxococcus llanfairpwllgwyngyllgogerychwyrndrobwllllantysiliogogogochensis TaxID=2590453 RepID=A0A540WLJ8_9BACT|nr:MULTISPECIES: cation diffusion facilitator family transporter [Myxococcus]NTX00295.1 cation transporter [Myxococcus sp. CA040A]TQF09294.1 cation transporter [Myxococcus llanfairpwllgwyngyllgogerychwyrndrobwllllantysiliogogogochensis]